MGIDVGKVVDGLPHYHDVQISNCCGSEFEGASLRSCEEIHAQS